MTSIARWSSLIKWLLFSFRRLPLLWSWTNLCMLLECGNYWTLALIRFSCFSNASIWGAILRRRLDVLSLGFGFGDGNLAYLGWFSQVLCCTVDHLFEMVLKLLVLLGVWLLIFKEVGFELLVVLFIGKLKLLTFLRLYIARRKSKPLFRSCLLVCLIRFHLILLELLLVRVKWRTFF